MKQKRYILITGGSGMLGRILASHFSRAGYQVIAPPQDELDLLDPNLVEHAVERFPACSAIIHCAAATDVNYCELNQSQCTEVNAAGTQRIVDLARRQKAKLFYISTPMVFSGTKGNYREHDRTAPINYYGTTKRGGEKLVLRYAHGIVIRSNPIGVRPAGTLPSFIQWFVDAAQSNRSFELFTDVRINPISTAALAGVLEKLLKIALHDSIFHVGSRDIVNKADVWEYILAHFPGYSGTVTRALVDRTTAGRTAVRPKEMWLNVEHIQESYRIPMPSWRHEVDLVLKELKI